MSQAPNYTPTEDFSQDELNNRGGRSTVDTAALDAEFAAIATAHNALNANVQLNQRDDGEIRDQRVKLHTLDPVVLKLVTAFGGTIRGAWLTATAYVAKDVVTQGGNTYVCAVAHTSGVFATDLAAVRWVLVQLGAATAASGVPFSPTATLSATNVQAAIDEADTENRALIAAEAGLRASADATEATARAAIVTRLANASNVADGDAMVAVKSTLTGAQDTTQHEKNADTVSLMEFIPAAERAAIRNFTTVTDHTTYINTFLAALNGRIGLVPAGLYNHRELQAPKANKLSLEGEFASYDGTEGSVFNYLGTGIGLQIGVDDGNPDSTGPARGCKISRIHFKTTTGATAIRFQNTALTEVQCIETRGFSGKVIDLRGNVITSFLFCGIAGTQGAGGVGSGSYGFWCDDQYFGNFVVDIKYCHIFQLNHAGRFSEGRSLSVFRNIVENIRPGAVGGVWELGTSGYISLAEFKKNYYENHRGYLYEGSGFTGAILQLVIKNEDGWGSGDAGNVNPGVGNLPRTKVFAHDIGGNNFVDASLNTQAALALASVYPSTSVFDAATTKVPASFGNREYEDDIVYALQTAELMKSAGDFAGITGGTPGTLAVGGSTQPSNNGAAASAPFGWTQVISGAVWNAVIDNILGSWVCYTPGSGSTFNLATYTQTLTPIATTRYFVVGFTSRGWSSLKLGAGSIYDSGAIIGAYHTEVVKFSVAPSTASFTLTTATNATASHWAEVRMFEIGSAEFNEPGALNGALTKAVKRLMRRGAY